MKFDGRALAVSLYQKQKEIVEQARISTHVQPKVSVFLIGNNPSSLSFIKQKRIAAEKIGAILTLSHSSDISFDQFKNAISGANTDKTVHGIIIQRPLPENRVDLTPLLTTLARKKDIDGFLDSSPYEVPVALGVLEILKEIARLSNTHSIRDFIHDKSVVILGRGVTAGAPIARMIEKLDITPTVIHSQTKNPKDIMKKADILISCVGKKHTVTKECLREGAILIGVGLSRDEDGTYSGDYDEKEIEGIVSWYTPTPGGVGPVNVACLMKNLVMSYTTYTGGTNL